MTRLDAPEGRSARHRHDLAVSLAVLLFVATASLVTAFCAHAQDAQVVILSADETREAKRLYEEQKAAEKRFEDFREVIRVRHLTTAETYNACVNTVTGKGDCPRTEHVTRFGWAAGFMFSQDFRAIVPLPQPVQTWPRYSTYPPNAIPVVTYNDAITSHADLRPFQENAVPDRGLNVIDWSAK